ncbi:MAG: hypothetical protein CL868_05855 [Cytophagaceae bacterium]|nr:hypothetical protein [Cytophagaceae bacterium]|tara:strand:+ start:9604 stop:10245 length:642 start_codon:yes stop_codon:yes gene_type:complete
MYEFLISLTSGLIGALIFYLFESFRKKKERIEGHKNQISDFINLGAKKIPDDILEHIDLGHNMKYINQILGEPQRFYKILAKKKTHINFYEFDNCIIQIFHRKQVVKAIIIHPLDNDSKIKIPYYNTYINSYKFRDVISNQGEKFIDLSSARDNNFAIKAYYGRLSAFITFYHYGEHSTPFKKKLSFEEIKNEVVIGFGMSYDDEILKFSHYR